MKKADVEAYFQRLPELDTLDSNQEAAVVALLGHPGFEVLMGLLIGEKLALMAELANRDLGDQAAVIRAAKLQGQIFGMDAVSRTYLELAEEISAREEAAAQAQEEQVNG